MQKSGVLCKFVPMKILIADAGGSSVDWCVVDSSGPVGRLQSPGCNASVMSDSELATAIGASAALGAVDAVVFYGAGCLPGEVSGRVERVLRSVHASAMAVEVHSDLLGAARAACGHRAGVVCILGTGSNSCVYDGRKIVRNTPSLGYILGDEGSGAALGRRFLSDVLKGILPPYLLDVPVSEVIENVYRRPAANRYLAGFTRVIKDVVDQVPAVHDLVVDEFSRFLARNVRPYEREFPLHFVGGVAAGFEKELREAAAGAGFSVATIMASPMTGLINYHMMQISN